MFSSLLITLFSSFFLVILDTALAHYTGSLVIFTITSFLLVSLFTQSLYRFWIIPLFFVGLESILFYNNFLLAFTWALPTIAFAFYLKNKMVFPMAAALISFIFLLILHTITLLFWGYKLPALSCTAWQISVNIIIIIMSLKCLPTVEQGNRS